MNNEIINKINTATNLTKREHDVLAYRFGITTGSCMTLEEVGKIYNVTRERIYQIESVALAKIL